MATEKKEEKDKKDSDNKSIDKDVILKESAYALCPIHKIQYPRGAKCPQCS